MLLQKARLRISSYNDQRKQRLNKRERRLQMISLSLTSMVDMFAILVIFLLTNSAAVSQWLDVAKGIELPKAKFSETPIRATTIQVTKESVLIGNKNLLSTSEISQPDKLTPLTMWLKQNPSSEKLINIVAHQNLSYGTIKRLVVACQESGFDRVNLAVQPIN